MVMTLTPGHFFYQVVIGSLGSSLRAVTNLWQWNLCLALARYFWKRWCADYFFNYIKYLIGTQLKNFKVEDIVVLQVVSVRSSLGRITELHFGKDATNAVIII